MSISESEIKDENLLTEDKNEENESLDSEEEEEDSDDDSEEEEDEVEPLLRYQRLGSSVGDILSREECSCMALHERFLAIGTNRGNVYQLDFNGDLIKTLDHIRGKISDTTVPDISGGSYQSTARITAVDIDSSGEFIASGGMNGRVRITEIYTGNSQEFIYKSPITCLKLSPDYAKSSKREFVVAGQDGVLILNSKGWFGPKDVVIHRGEGKIGSVAWKGTFIAWSNEVGVKVYDTNASQRITYIDRPLGLAQSEELNAQLYWETDRKLLIGWGDTIKIAVVKEKDPHQVAMGAPLYYMEIIIIIQTDYIIAGLVKMSSENMLVLAFDSDSAVEAVGLRPEFRVLNLHNEELSSDELSINGYEGFTPMNYSLCALHTMDEALFYIVSPKDVVVAKPTDLDDHLTWLLEREMYSEAMEAAYNGADKLRVHNLASIGEQNMGHLLQQGEFAKVGELCSKILGTDAALWEKWIYIFAQIKQLKYISKYIPTSNPQLSDTVYEMALGYFLHSDSSGFAKVIREWPNTLYSVPNVIAAVEAKLKKRNSKTLQSVLAELYSFEGQYDRAFHIYLTQKQPMVFDLIRQYNLFSAIQGERLYLLTELSPEKAIELFVESKDIILPDMVVKQLDKNPKWQHFYLKTLLNSDSHIATEYHQLAVKLTSEFEDEKTLEKFLRSSNYYNLEEAYEITKTKGLFRCQVFLLSRLGNNLGALNLILDELHDIKRAIEFAREADDEELWDVLISRSMQKASYVADLLDHIGSDIVDPVKLIKRIPPSMKIPNLRQKIINIIGDFSLQMALREGCNEILKADSVSLANDLNKELKKGTMINNSTSCPICMLPFIQAHGSSGSGILVINCGHVYHQDCLARGKNVGPESIPCPLCQKSKSRN